MEIITLLKANIRHRKGSFVSIILLMIIVAMSVTAIFSAQDNVIGAIDRELTSLDSGDILFFIKRTALTNELKAAVENSGLVGRTAEYSAVVAGKMSSGENIYESPLFIQKQREGYKLFNKALDGYEDVTPTLQKGEIYLPLGLETNMHCKIGDTVTAKTNFGEYTYTIKGFIAEPVNGSAMIGWTQLFIGSEDYDALEADCLAAETDTLSSDYRLLYVYKADGCELSDVRLCRQLNLETGILNYALGSMARSQSIYYTNLFAETILNIMLVFVVMLFIIVLIVMGHSITTGIEMEYVSLGVLKAQGFTNGKIKAVFTMQYLSAQLIGTIIGVAAAIPLTKLIGGIFLSLNSILANDGISFDKVAVVISAILILSFLFILISAAKIGKISPVKAIQGGHSEIYFDSRLNAPINKKALSATLGLRQFTTAKRQYIGMVAIVAILVFNMMTMMISGNTIASRSAMESMGLFISDCSLTLKTDFDDDTAEEIERAVSEISEIEETFYSTYRYASIDGEQIMTCVYKNPENYKAITKGRAPLYDNEIMITDIVADMYNIKIGDKLTLTNKDKTAEYLIVGSCQSLNDTGKVITMGIDAAQRLGEIDLANGGYTLVDKTKSDEVVKMLNEKYGDILEADVVGEEELTGLYKTAVDGMKLVIYVFSSLFALVVVNMVCKKAFLKEKTDIGIFKAIGFTAGRLRLQFAFRFLIIAAIGSLLGALLSMLFSGYVLNAMLRMIGITNYAINFTPLTFIFPIGLMSVCFFAFAYLAARRVKRVEIKELVSE